MTTLPNMGLTLPTRGPSGAGTWGDTLDANLALEDAHDHSSGKGVRIPTAGIALNADLPFSSLYAPTQLHRLQFSEIAGGALSNPNNLSLFVSDGTGGLTAHELYFRTSAGNNIRFTFGSSLNVAAFVGGIGGDYSSVSALLSYDDAGKQYKHFQGGGTAWARMTGGGLRLIEFGTTETVYVEQLAPAALSLSYSVTWPTALPGSQQIAQIDGTGQLVFSNTVPQAVTLSSGATVGSNQNITLSGTGDVKHGTRTLQLADKLFVPINGVAISSFNLNSSDVNAGSMQVACGIPLRAGDRITAIRFTGADSSTGPTKFQGNFGPYGGSSLGSTGSSAGTGTLQTLSVSSGLPVTIAAGTPYWLNFSTSTGTDHTSFRFVEVDFDRP